MSEGWIAIHRKIQECDIWDDKPYARGQAWLDLLLLANHDDKQVFFNGKSITVERGQRITSIKILGERWGWSRHKVSDFLNYLETVQMIEQKRDNKKTLITIVNYDIYQDVRLGKGHQKDTTGTPQGHRRDTNNNDNNDNNNNITPLISPLEEKWDFDKHSNLDNTKHYLNSGEYEEDKFIQESTGLWDTIKEWMKYKDERKPRSSNHYAESSIKKLLNKIVRMSKQYGVDVVIKTIDDSISSNYQGIVWDWCEKNPQKSKAEIDWKI